MLQLWCEGRDGASMVVTTKVMDGEDDEEEACKERER